mgnify:CR=1 FL=1
MGILKRGEHGKSSIREYYDQLKRDSWQGNTRDIRAPYYGPTGMRKHLHGAIVLGGLSLLGQFRGTERRLVTAAKYAVAPILGTTTLGKIANTALDVLRAGQQLGAIPTELTNHYADIPITLDPVARTKALFGASTVGNANDIRKKYGLQYNRDTSYDPTFGDPGSPDMIPVEFETNNLTIPVRGIIDGLTDTVTPTWNETSYVGRPQPVVTYGGFGRAISFNLTLAALSPQQLRPMWHKINDITKLVLPQSDQFNTRFAGRLVEVTIGNYLVRQLCVVGDVTMTISDDSYWELGDPDLHHPSLTLDTSLGNKLQTEVKRKIDTEFNKKLPLRTDKDKLKALAINSKARNIPLTVKERQDRHDKGNYKDFKMPRVVALAISLKVLHNEVPGTDGGPQLFEVNTPYSEPEAKNLKLPLGGF